MAITVHILEDGFTKEDYHSIEKIVNKFQANVYFYSFHTYQSLIESYHLPSWRGTQIANARLCFAHYIKNVEQLLYLDADTIVASSLEDLKKYKGSIHMVQDTMTKKHYQNLPIPVEKYYNSGVFWINTKAWENAHCDERIKQTAKQTQTYTYPDQDLINMALKNEIEPLPPAYNLFSVDAYYPLLLLSKFYKIRDIERYSWKEIKNAKENPIIYHSTTFHNQSPLEEKAFHPYKELYSTYLSQIYGPKEPCHDAIEAYLFKMHLYTSLLCPEKIKDTIKTLIKKA